MSIDKRQLRDFIDRVGEIDRNRNKRLSDEDLQDIALEMGISRKTLDAAREEGEKSLERGKQYISYKRWDDAIEELSDAVALLPSRAEARYQLARAFGRRYRENHHPSDLVRARELIKECLEIDPDYRECYRLLGRLDAVQKAPGRRTHRLALWVTIAGILPILVFAILAHVLPDRKPMHASSKRHRALGTSASSVQAKCVQTRTLPVQFTDSAQSKITFQTRSSILKVYRSASSYILKGILTNHSTREFHGVYATVQVLDSKGRVISSDMDWRLVSLISPAMRPGDTWPVHLVLRATPDSARARLTITLVEGDPAKGYPAPRPIQVDWSNVGGKDWKLEFSERWHRFTKSTRVQNQGYFTGDFQVTNRGQRPVKYLRVVTRYFDGSGKRIGSEPHFVVEKDGPSLLPGETRAFHNIKRIPDSFQSYRIYVAGIE